MYPLWAEGERSHATCGGPDSEKDRIREDVILDEQAQNFGETFAFVKQPNIIYFFLLYVALSAEHIVHLP